MRQKNRRPRPADLISAQEVASFAYCAESWRLQYGLELESGNHQVLAAGNRHHARKAVAASGSPEARSRWADSGRCGGRGAAPAGLVAVMILPAWIALAALLTLAIGLWLMLAGRGMRQRRGLGGGKTVSLDRVTLTSRRLRLTGRPDRLIKTEGTIIVEEWSSWT